MHHLVHQDTHDLFLHPLSAIDNMSHAEMNLFVVIVQFAPFRVRNAIRIIQMQRD